MQVPAVVSGDRGPCECLLNHVLHHCLLTPKVRSGISLRGPVGVPNASLSPSQRHILFPCILHTGTSQIVFTGEVSRPSVVGTPCASIADVRIVTHKDRCTLPGTHERLPKAAPQLTRYYSLAALLRLMEKFVLPKTDLYTKFTWYRVVFRCFLDATWIAQW